MLPLPNSFEFDYRGTDVLYGRDRARRLGEALDERDLDRALIVTGTNVGANPGVMDPLREGLGDRLVSTFAETTPEKRADTAFDGVEVMREADPDVLVAVGGGSSLDIARQMSAFESDGRPLSAFREAAREGDPESPNVEDPTPVIVVPTTFAGADLSAGGSVTVLDAEESPTGQPVRAMGFVSPVAGLYDPALFETTPMGALAGSAMNGFDKGIETIYAPDATPITDATAVRGLRLLREGLPALPDDPDAMERAVAGAILVQFDRRMSIVHAFGHGFRSYGVQQGVGHAVAVPHVLRYVFEETDARRDVLAEAFGVDPDRPDDEVAEAVVAEVAAVRDAIDLPGRIRDLDPIGEGDLPDLAALIADDHLMGAAPVDATEGEIEAVLREAW